MSDALAKPAGSPAFQEQVEETKTPSASPTETKESPTSQDEQPAEKEDSKVEPVEDADDGLESKKPLHKESRFREVVKERNRLREEREQWLEEKARFFEEQTRRQVPQETKTERPSWFVKYFGEGADADSAWAGMQGMTASAKEQAKAEAIAELKAETEAQKENVKQASEWVDEQINALDGNFDRNLLLKVMDEYRPTDPETGYLDFPTGLKLYQKLYPDNGKLKSEARKKLAADMGASTGKAEPEQRSYVTRADLRKSGGWDGILE